MKIVEVSKSYSLRTLLDTYFSYIEFDLMIFSSLSSEIIRQQQNLNFHDFGFIVFVDFEHESYLKYVTLKQTIGFTDEQVIWITTTEIKDKALISIDKVDTDQEQFKKINRNILHAKDEKNILLAMMKRFHYYNEHRLSKSIQETIQKMMKSMLGFLGEGILILDSDKKIIFMNVVAEEISGFTETEGLNRPFLEIFPMYNAITKEPISDVMVELSSDNPSIGLPYNTVVIDRNNQERYISANVSFLYKSLLKGYFIILRDISRIVHTENSFRRISKAVEYSPASVIIFGTNAIIDYVNPAFEALTGYGFEEIVGQSFEVLLSEDTSQAQYKIIWNTITKGSLWDGTLRNKKKSGDTFWEKVHIGPIFNDQDEIDRFVAINQDITHEVEMSNQIINERNNFYALIDLAPIGLMLFENNSTFSNINKRALAIIETIGIAAEELLKFKEISTQETMLSYLQGVHKNKRTFLQKEFVHFGKDDKEAYIRLGAVPFALGSIESVLIAIDDVTLNKLIEKQLEIARDEAKEADKAKSMFLANMSHEIRTPINGIIGMTDITLANKLLCKEDEENLKLVKVSSRNLLQIINDILDLSKLDAGKIDFEEIAFNVESIIETTLKLFEIKAEDKELYLKMNIKESGKKVLIGDPYRLQQCLTNLVNNAIKFTEIGGVEVTVRTQPIKGIDSMITLEIEVADTGIGIGESERKVLFKRFSQVDSSITRQYGGTGLGLAITKTLVQMQQGYIDLESEKGKGSKFFISIPYKIGQTSEILEAGEDEIVESEQLIQQVLIVEDDKINQLIIKKYLAQVVQTIDVASDGVEALTYVAKKKYDLVFMDIQLPGMSGIEVMKKIRNRYMSNEVYTPVIAVTANALIGDRENLLGEGFDYYVSKPYDKATLIKSIGKVYNDSFQDMRKTYETLTVPLIVGKISSIHANILNAFYSHKYIACTNYVGELRVIAKGFGNMSYGQKLLKLQLLLRKEDYVAFIQSFQEFGEHIQLVDITRW